MLVYIVSQEYASAAKSVPAAYFTSLRAAYRDARKIAAHMSDGQGWVKITAGNGRLGRSIIKQLFTTKSQP